MELNIKKRDRKSKSEAKQFRRSRKIPAVIYQRGKDAENIVVDQNEFSQLLRHIKQGRLSTSVFTLKDENGASRRAILKDIQYEITTYDVVHLDFEELNDKTPVNVKVPIECVGIVDCIGIKLGGVLRQVIRNVRVRCLPKDIPEAFELDVKSLAQRESKRLKDLSIPNTIRPLVDLNEVAVVIVKR